MGVWGSLADRGVRCVGKSSRERYEVCEEI